MSEEITPAQAAYEAACNWDTKHEPPLLLKPWADLGEADRDCWRQVASAVLDARTPFGDANIVTIEEHRWYAVIRNGRPDADVFKVIGYRGDSGISYHDSLAEWEAASQ